MFANPVEYIFLFSTGFVAFVLLLSGAAKVAGPSRTLDSMAALSVPVVAQRRWIAAAVPFWEIGLGLALLLAPGWLRSLAAALALATFAIFTVFVARVLRRGEDVDCGCFGPLSVDDRVTGWTVVRNIVLMAATGLVLATGWGSPSFVVQFVSADTSTALLVMLAWALLTVAVLAVAVVKLRRQPISTQSSVPAAPTGAALEGDPLPDAELVSAEGVTVPLHALGSGAPVLLIFLSAECGKCAAVARRLPQWQQEIGPSVLLRVATSSRPDVLKERMPEVLPFAYFGARSAKRALGVEGIPSAVLLGGVSYLKVASPIAHRDEIDALVRGIDQAQ